MDVEDVTASHGLPPVLTVKETAQFLRLDSKTIYDAIGAKQFPARRVGRRVLVYRDNLLDWLSGNEGVLPKRRSR